MPLSELREAARIYARLLERKQQPSWDQIKEMAMLFRQVSQLGADCNCPPMFCQIRGGFLKELPVGVICKDGERPK